MTMTKRDLVVRVASKLGITQSDVARIVEATFDTISQTLADGKRWELRDFGVFEVKTRASRIGRNPRTGDQVSRAGAKGRNISPREEDEGTG